MTGNFSTAYQEFNEFRYTGVYNNLSFFIYKALESFSELQDDYKNQTLSNTNV